MILALLLLTTRSAPAVSEHLVNYINSVPGITWTAGLSKRFAGLTKAQAKGMLMDSKLFSTGSSAPYEEVSLDDPIPNEWDFHKVAPQCRIPIHDQGECGACWSFSTLAAFSYRRCMKRIDQKAVDYSVQYQVSCDVKDSGCDGGEFEPAWAFVQASGVPTDECLPLSDDAFRKGVAGKCPTECVDGTKIKCAKASGGIKNVGMQNVTNIQKAIMKYGPVMASMVVFDDFYAYEKGIYYLVSGGDCGRHAVAIIGWGVENSTEYWLCRNSWGTNWGEDGYFRILRNTDECTIEDEVISGTV